MSRKERKCVAEISDTQNYYLHDLIKRMPYSNISDENQNSESLMMFTENCNETGNNFVQHPLEASFGNEGNILELEFVEKKI